MARIFDAYSQRVYKACWRHLGDRSDAEDAMSLVFLELWRTRHRAQLIDGSLWPWIAGIAGNVASHHHRAQSRYAAARARYEAIHSDPHEGHEDVVVNRLANMQQADLGLRALRALPADERQVADLCLVEGFTIAQAATALGLSTSATKRRLESARRRLRRALTRAGEEPDQAPSGGHYMVEPTRVPLTGGLPWT